jgi:hypothetical protein
MATNFMAPFNLDGKDRVAAILKETRKDGVYYEVNINGYPRFYMKWSALGRYDIINAHDFTIPYAVLLAVSDAIEAAVK